MTIGLLKEILAETPRNARLLGLDIGTKTIGLAVCDPNQSIATSLKTINRTKFTKDIAEMAPIIREYGIKGYILGYPLNMDGSEGPKCQSIRDFALEMNNHPDIFGDKPWIGLWDERLSTSAVEDFLVNDVDMSRTKRKQVIDKMAAQVILQGAIDFIHRA